MTTITSDALRKELWKLAGNNCDHILICINIEEIIGTTNKTPNATLYTAPG